MIFCLIFLAAGIFATYYLIYQLSDYNESETNEQEEETQQPYNSAARIIKEKYK